MLEAFFEKVRAPPVPHEPFLNVGAQVAWASEVAAVATPAARAVCCTVMADIRALAGDLGAQCLRETVAARRPEHVSRLNALKSDYDRGIWTWLHEPTVFEEACARWFFERRRPTGTWTDAFSIAPDATLDGDLGDLRKALQPVVDQYEAGPPGVAFERYELGDMRAEGGSATLLTIAYEGRWMTKSRIENGQESTLAERVVHHLAVQIESCGRMYVVSDRRSAKLRSAIARAVAQVGLGLADAPDRLPPQRYNLQRLLDPAPFRWDPAHKIEAVCVPSLTLEIARLGRTKLRTFSSPEFGDVRDLVLAELRPADRLTARVLGGQLRVIFGPRPGRRRSHPVTIGFGPKAVSMNLNSSEEDLLRARYFDAWGFHLPPQSGRTR